jgi:hypothetical protein
MPLLYLFDRNDTVKKTGGSSPDFLGQKAGIFAVEMGYLSNKCSVLILIFAAASWASYRGGV